MKTPKDKSTKTNRRKAIKVIGGGAIAGGAVTTKSWQKPVVDSVVIPTHANMTAGGGEPGTGTPAPTTVPVTTSGPPSTTVAPDSDIRLKTDISKLDQLANGHQLYSFRYTRDENRQRYVGVMAQDLLADNAEAIVTREDGYLQVDYGKLGLRMVTLEEWEEGGLKSIVRPN